LDRGRPGLRLSLGDAVFLAGITIPGIVGADEGERLAAGIAWILFSLLVSFFRRRVSS
jgi:hypothetical protein